MINGLENRKTNFYWLLKYSYSNSNKPLTISWGIAKKKDHSLNEVKSDCKRKKLPITTGENTHPFSFYLGAKINQWLNRRRITVVTKSYQSVKS